MDFLRIIFGDSATPEGRMASEMMGAYERHLLLDRAGDYLFETEDEKLRKDNQLLDIAMKRRALGLPMTSDDYEQAQNESRPYRTTMTTLAGREVSQLIPESTPLGKGAVKLPWASPAPALERGLLGALTGIGGKYAGSIGRGIGRLFG